MLHIRLERYKIGERGALIGISVNVFLLVLKFSAGILGRSQAMIADACHTASDLLTSIGVFVGFKLARQPADPHHPFGHGRAESIVAKIMSVILILGGIGVAYESVKVLISGKLHEPANIAWIVAIIAIIVKWITYRRVLEISEKIQSTSLKADARDHKGDMLSSVAALIGIVGAKLGQPFMDPLAGVVVAGLIVKMGTDSFHEAYDELMDAAPSEKLKGKIEQIVKTVGDVETVRKIMIRKTGIEILLEITIAVNGNKTVTEGHLITMRIKREILKEFSNMRDTIVHVEPI